MIIFTLLLALVPLFHDAQSANILAMVPMPYHSHLISYQGIFRGLAARGHNVTVVSAFPQKTPVPNLTDITVPNIVGEVTKVLPSNLLDMDSLSIKLFGLWSLGLKGTETALNMKEIQRLINDTTSKFDLIIFEGFLEEAFHAFGHKFNAPVVQLIPCPIMPFPAYITGNDLALHAYVPSVIYDFTDHMSFPQRLLNIISYYGEVFYGEYVHLDKQEKLMRSHFKYPGSENIPPLREMVRNTSLTLVNYHLAGGYQMPLHKNVIPFGGTNIKRPEKLPNDLQSLMDNAKDGVIYFSFGTFFSVGNLKPFMIEAIMSVLAKVKQKVLLKSDDPTLAERFKSENIEVRKWFPQPSVLAHPNCKLFITHGGYNGMLDAIYHGVPMIAFPILGDQKYNSKFMSKIGIGKVLDIGSITESKLMDAVNTVLKDKSYQENIKKQSAIFRDNPVDTLDNVMYWIEYVIRHKGAAHLRPAVLDLHWYQRLMLDVIGFYLLVIFLIVYITVKIMTLLLTIIAKMYCSKTSNRKSKKSKKE